ncbi:hypothetical protein K488DRAFT_61505, partial [Vararia minispora EC-137]
SSVVLADVPLIVPGFDPQPLSAAVIGTDAAGHTTWQIMPGTATDSAAVDFVGTATLVESPSDAHLTYQNPALSLDFEITCNIAASVATCTGLKGFQTSPFPLGTQTAFAVQGDAALPTSALGGSASNATPGSSGAGLPSSTASGTSRTASPSASSTPSSGPSTSVNGGVRVISTVSRIGMAAMGLLYPLVL